MIKSKKIFHCTLSCLVTASYIKKASVSPLEVKHIMDPVMRAVNAIRAHGLKHRQFPSFLEDIEADSDVLYHTNVRWLSMGKGLKRDCHVFQYE